MSKGAIYCRVSTDEQEANGMSLSYQRESCLKFAETNGLKVPEDFVFLESYSGGFLDRPQLDKVLDLARRGEISFVIFTKRDRVARDQYVFQKIMKDFSGAGVRVYYSEEKLTGDFAMDAFIGSTIVWFASWEREQIKLRTNAGKRQHAKSGRWPFAFIPYGYQKNPKTQELEIFEPDFLQNRTAYANLGRATIQKGRTACRKECFIRLKKSFSLRISTRRSSERSFASSRWARANESARSKTVCSINRLGHSSDSFVESMPLPKTFVAKWYGRTCVSFIPIDDEGVAATGRSRPVSFW